MLIENWFYAPCKNYTLCINMSSSSTVYILHMYDCRSYLQFWRKELLLLFLFTSCSTNWSSTPRYHWKLCVFVFFDKIPWHSLHGISTMGVAINVYALFVRLDFIGCPGISGRVILKATKSAKGEKRNTVDRHAWLAKMTGQILTRLTK